MSTARECCCAGRDARGDAPRGALGASSVLGALLSGLALVLVPKCPLCLAAYLSVVMSAGVAAPLARVIHPLGLVAAALGLGLVIVRLARRAPVR